MLRTTTARTGLAALLLIGILALALLAAGCGSSTAASPSPSPSESSVAQKLAAFQAYLTQVTPIYNQTSAALTSLDGSLSSLSKKPDKTWAASATQMTTASAALGTAATDLAALAPPASLQSTQDGAVSALQAAQKVLDTTSSYLTKRVYDPNYPDIKTQIKQQVSMALAAVWSSMFSASGASPSPAP